MTQYYGDFAEDDTVYLYFNTFDSNDPSASVTITNLVDADIHVHKDAGTTQIATDGATIAIDFDSITGNHIATIDTSAHADYSTGSEYAARIEGTTVDGATINAWIGAWSIERAGGALALIKAGSLSADVVSISGDSGAADNLELQYDGTGVTGDNFPSTQSQVGNLAIGSASISTPAASYVLTTGTQSSGTITDTETLDGVVHAHTDTGGALELYYQFDVGGSGVATETQIHGRINGNNDDLDGVYAYNWGGASWDQVGNYEGQASSVNTTQNMPLLTRHTGTGANLGLVRIRFYAASGLTSATLNIDQIFTSYAVVAQSVGYANGAIWIDTNNGTAGTEEYVNGTADNPVDSLADAITLGTSLGLVRFEVINGSSITFGESHDNETWIGVGWSLALGGQSISSSSISGATLSGTATGASRPSLERCTIGTVTLPPCRINGGSGFSDTFTFGSAGNFDIIDCTSLVAGTGTPTFDLGAAVGASNVSIRDWHGGLTFNNILTGDVISMEGLGGTITVNGTGGSINIRGIFEGVTDNSSAAVTIQETAMINRQSLVGYENGAVWIDTNGTNSGIITYVDGTADNPVNNLADALTIAGNVGTNGVQVIELLPGSSITLTSTLNNWEFLGRGYTIDLGSQDVGGTRFIGGIITGIGTGASRIVFRDCLINAVTSNSATFLNCQLLNSLTMAAASSYKLDGCFSGTSGTTGITFDYGAAVGNTVLTMTHWSGIIQLENMGDTGTDTANISGQGQFIEGTCTGGNVYIDGHFTTSGVTNLTLTENARIDTLQINAEVDTGLTDYDGPTNAEMEARTILAAAYFDPATDTVANVTTVATTTTNTDMRGTDSANTVVPMTAVLSQTEHDATQSAISDQNDIAATDIVSAGAITTSNGAVVNVDLVDVVTTNTDVRGTDNALLAASINLTAGTVDRVTLVDTTTTNTDMRGTDSASTHSAADVWAVATRVLTANTNLNDPTTAEIVTAIEAIVIETGYTITQTLQLIAAATAGKLSGAATTTNTMRSLDDSANRIVATVDTDGNRSAVTHDV